MSPIIRTIATAASALALAGFVGVTFLPRTADARANVRAHARTNVGPSVNHNRKHAGMYPGKDGAGTYHPPKPHPNPPHPPHPHPYPYYPDHYHYPWGAVAAGTVIGAAAASVGQYVEVLPSNCISEVVRGISYWNCGGMWYQPRYSGSSIVYVVVPAP